MALILIFGKISLPNLFTNIQNPNHTIKKNMLCIHTIMDYFPPFIGKKWVNMNSHQRKKDNTEKIKQQQLLITCSTKT